MRYEDVFGFIDADTPIPNGFCPIPLENRPQVLAEIASIVRDEKKVKNAMTMREQRAFLRDYPGADVRIRRGQAPTLMDREIIHKALVMVYSLVIADLNEDDELNKDTC